MGVKKLLQAGIENEEKAFSDKGVAPKTRDEKNDPIPVSNGEILKDKEEEKNKIKKKGGRPTNEEAGLKCRKQYTLTLKEEDYQEFLSVARLEGSSFAKFMEKAAKEYISISQIRKDFFSIAKVEDISFTRFMEKAVKEYIEKNK